MHRLLILLAPLAIFAQTTALTVDCGAPMTAGAVTRISINSPIHPQTISGNGVVSGGLCVDIPATVYAATQAKSAEPVRFTAKGSQPVTVSADADHLYFFRLFAALSQDREAAVRSNTSVQAAAAAKTAAEVSVAAPIDQYAAQVQAAIALMAAQQKAAATQTTPVTPQ